MNLSCLLISEGIIVDILFYFKCSFIQSVNPKGDQSWIFIGRTDAEAETPILLPPDELTHWKDPDAGKDWRQEEKGTTEDEMVGWHTDLMAMSLSKLRELVMDREAWRAAVHRAAKSQTRLSNWAELNAYVADPLYVTNCLIVHTVCTVRWTQGRQGVSYKAGKKCKEL